jgi:hypothetical protein
VIAPVVQVHPLDRIALGLPVVSRPGRIHVSEVGETMIIREDGTAEVVVQGGRPRGGIAELASAGRAP